MLAIRLNSTSDLDWPALVPELFAVSDLIAYDYTRAAARLHRDLPANYVLILSYTGRNWRQCRAYLD